MRESHLKRLEARLDFDEWRHRLMIRVFKYLGNLVEERFRKIRQQRYEEKLEKELREKMLNEGKEGGE